MALPETVVVRRKDILEHLGISRWKFAAFIKAGHFRQIGMEKKLGKIVNRPMYLRDDVLKVEQMLKGEPC